MERETKNEGLFQCGDHWSLDTLSRERTVAFRAVVKVAKGIQWATMGFAFRGVSQLLPTTTVLIQRLSLAPRCAVPVSRRKSTLPLLSRPQSIWRWQDCKLR